MPLTKDVLLVAVTGYGRDEDRNRAHDAGFDHHLVKPLDFGALRHVFAAMNGNHAPASPPSEVAEVLKAAAD